MKELTLLGLSKNEAKLYEALLVLKKSGAGDLAKKADVPHSRVYDYLDSLIQKGFVNIFPGKTKQFVPASPDELMEIIDKKREELDKTKEIVDELSQIYKNNPEQPIEYAVGESNFWKFISKLPKSEKSTRTIKWNAEYRPDIVRRFKEKRRKKINVKVMTRFDESTEENIKKWAKIDKKLKPIDNEGVVMEIVDDKSIFITLIESNGTLVIRDKPFIKMMKDLYDTKYNSIKETCYDLLKK